MAPLELLRADDMINDIMVRGTAHVVIERLGKLVRAGVHFCNAQQVSNIAQKMAATVGRRVDESSPPVDCRLRDGSRVDVVAPPLAIDGCSISIRKLSKKKIDLRRWGCPVVPDPARPP